MAAHVAGRLRMGGGLGHGRPVATVALSGLVPAAVVLPALASLSLVALACAALIAYEALRYRYARPGSAAGAATSQPRRYGARAERGAARPRAERHPWRGVDSAERAVPTVNEAALECRRPSLPEPNAPC
jgi:hypothetical protein